MITWDKWYKVGAIEDKLSNQAVWVYDQEDGELNYITDSDTLRYHNYTHIMLPKDRLKEPCKPNEIDYDGLINRVCERLPITLGVEVAKIIRAFEKEKQ